MGLTIQPQFTGILLDTEVVVVVVVVVDFVVGIFSLLISGMKHWINKQ